MNNFKEYSAAFHEKNDLMHYGVKGMKWNPNKKKRAAETTIDDGKKIDKPSYNKKSEEDKTRESEQRKNAAKTVGLAGRAGLGASILKGIYDNVPKNKNIINAKSFRKHTVFASSRKEPTGVKTASGGLRVGSSGSGIRVSETTKRKKKLKSKS